MKNITSEHKLSVRELVEFVMRSGDIDESYSSQNLEEILQEGIRLHQYLQKKREQECKLYNAEYIKERNVKYEYKTENHSFFINGRIDGIISSENEIIVEEIKSTRKPVNKISLPATDYMAQLKVYAFFLCKELDIAVIKINLTYIEVDTLQTKIFEYIEDIKDLEQFFLDIIQKYEIFANLKKSLWHDMIKTGASIQFPYGNYRPSQYKLMQNIYKTIKNNSTIYVEAPTGTGKTISTIFPSIKALSSKEIEKVFYATAKTITRKVAIDTIKSLNCNGLKMSSIMLISKDKCCKKEIRNCTPEYCEYAKGHFDRVNDAILDIMENEIIIDPTVLDKYSVKHTVCPYEFALDISTFCFFIICDYNNVYEPRSKLIRFFDKGGNYTLLFDEAHNLDDRAIEMFSSEFNSSALVELRQNLPITAKKTIYSINKILKLFTQYKNQIDIGETIVQNTLLDNLYFDLLNLKKQLDKLIEEKKLKKDIVTDFIFYLLEFSTIIEHFGDNYKFIITRPANDEYIFRLQCLNAGPFINSINKSCKGVVYFSATLSPPTFYRDSYGGDSNDFCMRLENPFDQDNCLYLVDNSISTYYNSRQQSIPQISKKIHYATKNRVGNYFVFFSSYEHMEQVLQRFISDGYDNNIDIVKQTTGLTEDEKEQFVNQFTHKSDKSKIAFLVMGGMFSEGIDLFGDSLIGVIVVGVGLPKITVERNLMKDYYEEQKEGTGFSYAYTYKGLAKLEQSMGRLIRTETDKGFILLMDIRFGKSEYLDLLPFTEYYKVTTPNQISQVIIRFWEQHKKV